MYTTDGAGNRVADAERTAKTTPPGNGAWLMKNSRGSETDAIPDGMIAPDGTAYPEHRSDWSLENEEELHTGYNWISYYDQSLARPLTMAFSIEEEGTEAGILQYHRRKRAASVVVFRLLELAVLFAEIQQLHGNIGK